ncbi:MAG: hypothetical protein ABL308_06200 [Oceanicaulis sp.]
MAEASVAPASRTPIWFYVVAVLAVVFNLGGLFSYVSLQLGGPPAGMTPEQTAYFESFPAWYDALYALTVHASVAAALLLVFRRRIAGPVFAAALGLYLISSIWHFGVRDAFAILGAGNLAFSAVIGAQLAALWWFSRFSERRGWLK